MGGGPLDLALRALRLLLASWLLVGPFLLGFGGTWPQKQDAAIGFALLPLMAFGLFVPGMRIVLLLAGAWLVVMPSLAPEYAFAPAAIWHDRIVGLACLFLGVLPLPTEGPAEELEEFPSAAPARASRRIGDRLRWHVFRWRRASA